jgi:hypothetical protein
VLKATSDTMRTRGVFAPFDAFVCLVFVIAGLELIKDHGSHPALLSLVTGRKNFPQRGLP